MSELSQSGTLAKPQKQSDRSPRKHRVEIREQPRSNVHTPLSKRGLRTDRLQTDTGGPHEAGRRAGSVTGHHSTQVIKSGQDVLSPMCPRLCKSALGHQLTRSVYAGGLCTCYLLPPISSSTEGHPCDSGHPNQFLISDSMLSTATLFILPECSLLTYLLTHLLFS